MTDEVTLNEPGKLPEVVETEVDPRTTLVKAIEDEIDFLDELVETFGDNKNSIQRQIFAWQAKSLSRILMRWSGEADFEVDHKERQIVQVDL